MDHGRDVQCVERGVLGGKKMTATEMARLCEFYESHPTASVADTARYVGKGYRQTLAALHEAGISVRHSWTRMEPDWSRRCPGPGTLHFLVGDKTAETCPICAFREYIAPYLRDQQLALDFCDTICYNDSEDEE